MEWRTVQAKKKNWVLLGSSFTKFYLMNGTQNSFFTKWVPRHNSHFASIFQRIRCLYRKADNTIRRHTFWVKVSANATRQKTKMISRMREKVTTLYSSLKEDLLNFRDILMHSCENHIYVIFKQKFVRYFSWNVNRLKVFYYYRYLPLLIWQTATRSRFIAIQRSNCQSGVLHRTLGTERPSWESNRL